MPQNFDDKTYVAYSDLCGFKELMKRPPEAHRALNHLYNKTYELLDGVEHPDLSALAFSDCVVAWVHEHGADQGRLFSLSAFLKALHTKMITEDYLMRTTIAYGDFRYQQRIELPTLRKDMILGAAYLDAYLENRKPEIGAIVLLDKNGVASPQGELWKQRRNPKGWEYFWAARGVEDIQRLRRERKDSYQARFKHLITAYKSRVVQLQARDHRIER